MRRILILMSNTGGGHRASAEALIEAFAASYAPEISVSMVDAWMDHTPWPLKHVPRSYEFIVDTSPWLYAALFDLAKHPRLLGPLVHAAAHFSASSFQRAVEEHSPDLLISVHPLMQAAPLHIMGSWPHPIPLVTVVTDLWSCHPSWFHPDVVLCFVPTAEVYARALDAGLRADQIRQCGLPIRRAFAAPLPPRAEVRASLGMDPDLPAALLMGGGEGMGPVAEIADAVAARLAHAESGTTAPTGQLVVICGRNRRLKDRLSSMEWPIPVRINGFVDNMPDWMSACDCAITKAGPGAIAESLSRGLPLLLSGFIPGQETGNVDYVIANGVGVYEHDPAAIAEIVAHWFGAGRPDLARLAANARNLADPGAAGAIADQIARLLLS